MLRTPEPYMRRAIAVAKQATYDGGAAIGAVIVDESGEVIAVGESLVRVAKDPTSHAEINAIRAAAKKRGGDDLFGCVLYCTLEPCHMCLSAAAWARLANVYFGAYRKDVDAALFDIKGDFSDEKEAARMNLRGDVKMKAQGGFLEAECAALLSS